MGLCYWDAPGERSRQQCAVGPRFHCLNCGSTVCLSCSLDLRSHDMEELSTARELATYGLFPWNVRFVGSSIICLFSCFCNSLYYLFCFFCCFFNDFLDFSVLGFFISFISGIFNFFISVLYGLFDIRSFSLFLNSFLNCSSS